MPELSALHIVASINANTGGPAVSVTGLAAALSRHGVHTRIASLDYPEHGALVHAPGVAFATVVPGALGKRLRGWSPALGSAIADIAAHGVDIIHHHGLWMYPGIYARRVAIGYSKPLVISPRGMLDEWALERGSARKALASLAYERKNLRAARLLHATSRMEADAIRRNQLMQPIAIIPNGVEVPNAVVGPGREAIDASYPVLRGRRWLLFMGRLHPKKGLDMLVQAWSLLAPDFPEWHLVVAGPDLDGYGAELSATIARDPTLAHRIVATGMVEGTAKEALLAHADLFVLPTRSENFGITVAEALGRGVPVVTTTAAPWSELVSRGCGWWVPPDTPAITKALQTAMSLAPEERKAMGERGRCYAVQEFSWDSIGARMADVYRWIVTGGPTPACVHEL